MQPPFKAYQGGEPYIFVSYAHEDSDAVYPEIQWLKDQGFNLWYDEGISPGDEWRDELGERIATASLFLYFVSPPSVASEHCLREVNYAIDQKTPLLVVHFQATELPHGLGMSLSSLQAILKYELSDLDYRIKLLDGVSDHIRRGIGVAVAPAHAVVGLSPRAMAVIGILTLVIGFGLWAFNPWTSEAPVRPIDGSPRQFILDMTPGSQGFAFDSLAITDNDSHFIFTGQDKQTTRLFSRALADLEQLEPQPISGTEIGSNASFALSPDNRHLVFASLRQINQLYKIALTGGKPVVLTGSFSGSTRGLSWGAGGTIVFATSEIPALMQVSAEGGTATQLTTPSPGKSHWHPHFLPEGGALLFTIGDNNKPSTSEVALLDLESGKVIPLLVGTAPRLTASNHLLFSRDRAVWVAAFDRQHRTVVSEAVPVLDNISTYPSIGHAQYAVSRQGTLVYWTAAALDTALVWVDRQGREERLATPVGAYANPRLSPDGEHIAVAKLAPVADIWIYSIRRDTMTALTYDEAANYFPVWSPDGSNVVFAMNPDGPYNLFSKQANGTGEIQRVTSSDRGHFPAAWGEPRVLLLTDCDIYCRIGMLPPEGDANVVTLLETEKVDKSSPALSPDGRWLAYVSDQTGTNEVYVSPFPDVHDASWPISTAGGWSPTWAPDRGELFYESESGMMAVVVKAEPSFDAERPTLLFDLTPYTKGGPAVRHYDVAPSGDRFLMVKRLSTSKPKFVMVENFFDELERLAPHPE